MKKTTTITLGSLTAPAAIYDSVGSPSCMVLRLKKSLSCVNEFLGKHIAIYKPYFLILFVFIFLTSTQTPAAIVMDTTSNKSATLAVPPTTGSLSSVAKGWTFTVVDGTWTINDVAWGLYANSSGTANMSVRLYSGSGVSGTLLESSVVNTLTLNPIGTAQYYDWSGLSWNVNPGTYTIAAYYSGGTRTPRLAATSVTMVADPSWFVIGPTEAGDNYALFVQASSGTAAVPEPGQVASSMLLLAGIAGYLAYRRRMGAATEPDALHKLALGSRGIADFRADKAA